MLHLNVSVFTQHQQQIFFWAHTVKDLLPETKLLHKDDDAGWMKHSA